MSRIKVAVVGATGRMGRMIIESALKDSAVELVAAIDLPGSSLVGKPAGDDAKEGIVFNLGRKRVKTQYHVGGLARAVRCVNCRSNSAQIEYADRHPNPVVQDVCEDLAAIR